MTEYSKLCKGRHNKIIRYTAIKVALTSSIKYDFRPQFGKFCAGDNIQ